MKKGIISIIIISLILMLLAFFIDVKKEDKDIKSDGITYSVDNIPKNLEKITKLSKRDEDIICATSIPLVEKDSEGNIILADEVSPDTCRLWDVDTNEKLDKDRFRRNLGDLVQGYEEVLARMSN